MAIDKLNENQVEAVIQFAQGIWAMEKYGIYTPWMQNMNLNNLNNSASVPTTETIKKALADYKNKAENLQNYMQFMQHFDMLFARTVKSYVNMLSFDLIPVCTNAKPEDYQSEKYLTDKKRVYDFLDKFDYKAEFRKVLEQVLINEVYFTWFRKSKHGNKGMKYALQVMPQNNCLLTGYWEKGLLFDFDMNYFLQPSIDIDGFDPFFKIAYNKIFNNPEIDYNPTASFNKRTGTYAYWTQTSPANGAWAWKFDMSNFNATPFLSALLKDAMRDNEIGELQFNKDMIGAYGILAGSIPLFDNAKSGTKANQFAIDPATLGGFMAKAKAGLGNNIKLAALPLESPNMYQFNDTNSDMYKDQLATTAGIGSGVSRVIYSSDRMSNAEIEAGIIDQYNTVKPMYYQFQNFMEYYVNQITKNFHFSFIFDGCSYPFEREKRFDRIMKIADKGMVLPPAVFASAMGYEPQNFERMLEESKYSGWSKLWQLPLNSATTAQSSDDQGGRPTKETGELSDSGEMSRNADGDL